MRRVLVCALSWAIATFSICGFAAADNPSNRATNSPGELPKGEDGRPLNLDFEKGTLDDWTATGKAWEGQPIKGEIDPNRTFGQDKKAEHTGEFWIGGYEKLQDPPQGMLTSVPFTVTHPYGSFLLGGGRANETRVELVQADNKKVFFTANGTDQENLRPVVVDLKPLKDKKIFIRVVDAHSGGWGHVNFDDFRFHAVEPKFKYQILNRPVPQAAKLYPNAGLTAEAAAKAMELPKGFAVQVAAAEPAVQQPIAMAFDDRGRLWIAEAYEYPRRAPEGKGRDRILIFEDTDLDGTLDKRTVFFEGLNLVSGLEVGFGGVWVGAAPYLQFIPDRNGDDKPDGPPENLLDGWAYQDTHETLNTFIWGPDGWLYGCHGVFTHSNVGKPGAADAARKKLNAGIWRYHPTRHEFEVFAEGTSNPWGVDFNERGQAFATACVIPHLYHIIQGARYQRQAGNHFNPYTYDDIKTIADHLHYTGNQWNDANRRESDELGGGHAHAGAMIYLGGSWPAEYRDHIFMHNIHGNRVNRDLLAVEGSGYVGGHGPDFLLTRDQWSQCLNLRYGPDGQVWMIDWYDKNQCHHGDPNGHDRSNGRIYRISYNGAKPVQVDLKKLTDAQLIEHLSNPNEWYVRHARRILAERAAAMQLAGLTKASLVEMAVRGADEAKRLRGLWGLHVTGGIPVNTTMRLLETDPSPYVRGWAIQLETDYRDNPPPAAVLDRMAELARTDSSPVVRLYLASAAQRVPQAARWGILEGLVRHDNIGDHNLPLMIWYAAEPLAAENPRRALALALSAGEKVPRLAEFMIRRIGGADPDKSLSLLVSGLGEAKEPASQLTFLRGMNEALRGRRMFAAPADWTALRTALAKSESAEVRLQAAALALNFGEQKAAEELRAIVADGKGEPALRREALRFLVKAKDAKLVALLHSLLSDPLLQPEAIRSLAAFDDAQTPSLLLALYPALPPAERRDALTTLCSRPTFAQALLSAVEKKEVPASALSADLVRQMRNLKNADVSKRLESVWGAVRDTPAEKLAQIEKFKQLMTYPATSAPDKELGRATFARTCQQCHTLFGIGGKVGPDLTGSNRANLDYLLTNIVDPSAVMAKEYQASVLVLVDGRVLTGILKSTTADTVVLQSANELLTIPRADIEEMQTSPKSMMPEDQLQQFSPHEVRSLLTYLASPAQTPLLATEESAKAFFNKKDLTYWRGDPALWSVENGEIVGRTAGLKHNAFLVSDLALEDFHLTLEVRLVKNEGNSGIQFRSVPLPNGEMRGYQADIGAGWWGKLYEESGRALLWDKSGEKHVKLDDWNKYEVIAAGSKIRTLINGELCVDLDDPAGARRGVVGLQLHSGGATEVRFRNLELKLLKK